MVWCVCPRHAQDLLNAQAALDAVQAKRDQFAQTLPWSVEPLPR